MIAPIFLSVTDVIKTNDLGRYMPPGSSHYSEPQIRRITRDDLYQIQVKHGRVVQNRFLERLTSSKGYQVIMEDTTVGWLWTTRHRRPKEGVPPFIYAVHPPERSTYIYDVYTAPAARRRGVMTALFPHALAELKQQGIRCAFFTHDRNNTAMERLARANGFISAGYLHYRRWLGWQDQDITDLEKICVLN